ncbi:MAG: MbnP family copper-binding protein [Myxococcaceae bacterium]
MISRPILFVLMTGALAGCGGTAAPVRTLQFAARVGEQTFACGQSFTGLGTTGTTYEPRDLRFYVHDVRLIDEGGAETAVQLEEDGAFQGQGVGLLDFEDKSGACSNGTTQTHMALTFTAPDRDWKGLRFRVGIPEALNHGDASIAKSPLNLTSMFWGWQGGYKFIRLDGRSTGLSTGHNFHFGSTGCAGSPVVCSSPNQFEVSFDAFDLDTQQVVFDVKALFEGSDLDSNAASTPPGCQSATNADPDCGPLFERLGLSGGPQTVFRKEAR